MNSEDSKLQPTEKNPNFQGKIERSIDNRVMGLCRLDPVEHSLEAVSSFLLDLTSDPKDEKAVHHTNHLEASESHLPRIYFLFLLVGFEIGCCSICAWMVRVWRTGGEENYAGLIHEDLGVSTRILTYAMENSVRRYSLGDG